MKLALIPLSLLLALSPAARAAPPTPEEEARVFSQIRQRMQAFTSKYRGVRSTRRVRVREYDPDDNKLRRTMDKVQQFDNLIYASPQIKVQGCAIDNKRVPTKRCAEKRKRKPLHPVFDKDGSRHYRVKIIGAKTVRERQCFEVRVTPLKKTEKHFSGLMYFDAENLQLLMLDGRLADYPFGLQKFHIRLLFKRHQGFAVVEKGRLDFTIHVPIFVNKRLVSTFSATNFSLLPRSNLP